MRAPHLLALALGLAACDPRLYAAKGEDEPKKAGKHPAAEPADHGDDDDEPPPAPPMSPFALLGALGREKEPGPFDEPRRSAAFSSGKPYSAVLELSGAIVELAPPFSFSFPPSAGDHGVELRALTSRLERLDEDDAVAELVVRLGDLELGAAVGEELGAALAALKKPVRCHVERVDDAVARVLVGCKRVALAPAGTVTLTGPALVPLYFKDLLDKVGASADVVRVSAYKGAAEPLIRNDPSPEMRETYGALLDGAYASLVAALARGRHVDAKVVEGWIDRAVFDADEAKRAGIVDEVATFEATRDAAPGGAWKRVKVAESKGGDFMSLLGLGPKKRVKGAHVALLYAVGSVVEGKGSLGGAFEEIAAGRLAPALRAATADEDVKAIVVRVDSPGGSALASELIWQAMADAGRAKPVVVSMGAVAASGGYYIAAPAAKIYAEPDTLTGSIGVFSLKIVLGGVLEKLGVHAVEMGRGKRAMLFSAVRPWTDDERQAMTAAIQSTYTLFKKRVGDGRHLAAAAVEASAEGRVFTGLEAKKRGLVDEIGGLSAALAAARAAAKLPADAPIEAYPGELNLLELLGAGGGVRSSLTALLQPAFAPAALLGRGAARALADAAHLALAAQGAPLQAAAYLPLIR
jgi:protease-4